MKSYKQAINNILQITEEDQVEDYWRDRNEIPIFSRKPFRDYEDGKIPDSEVITLRVDTRDAQSRTPFNALMCASTGVGKTRLVKNIVKGFWKAGYRILYIEPKSFEMFNARKMGRGQRIHPKDRNESLPVVSYCPNYIKTYLEKNQPELHSKVRFYSPDIRMLNNREIWQSLGIPDKAADMMVAAIESGHVNLEYFIKMVVNAKLMSQTKTAAISSLENLKGTGFFRNNKQLELKKEWDEGNIVVVNYFSRDGAFMNTDVGLILDLVRDISQDESRKGLHNVTKKLIIFDDAFYYAGISATLANTNGRVNLAIRSMANAQNNYRTWGIDTLTIVQSPDSNAIITSLIDGCTTKFVSYTENPQALNGKLPYDAFQLVSNTNPIDPMLYVDEDDYVFQWLYVRGKIKWVTGFPFDCTVGHT